MVIKKVNLDIVIGVTSAIPDTEFPEVAFAGKSNVGKSSLILLTDYKNQYGLEDILAFKAGYNISDSEVSTVGTSGNNSVMDNAGYYKNMKTII